MQKKLILSQMLVSDLYLADFIQKVFFQLSSFQKMPTSAFYTHNFCIIYRYKPT